MQLRRLTPFLLSISLALASVASAEQRVLFTPPGGAAGITEDYDSQVLSVSPGDELIFSGKKERFVIIDRPKSDHGHTSFVFEVPNGRMIRVAVRREEFHGGHFMRETLEGAAKLSRTPIAHVHVHRRQSSRKLEFVLVDKIPIETTLDDFLKDYRWNRIEPSRMESMVRGLETFFRQSAFFMELSDLNPRNVAWNGRYWILFDWISGIQVAESEKDASPWDGYMNLFPDGLRKRLKGAFNDERALRFRDPFSPAAREWAQIRKSKLRSHPAMFARCREKLQPRSQD